MKITLAFLITGLISLAAAGALPRLPRFLPPPPADECGGLGAEGLQEFMGKVVALFPIDDFLDIVVEALSEDEEVQLIFEMFGGPHVGRIVFDIMNMEEWRRFVDYFCDELSFNVSFYLIEFGRFIGVQPIPPPEPESTTIDPEITSTTIEPETTSTTTSTPETTSVDLSEKRTLKRDRQPGLIGLILAIYEILPIDEVIELYREELPNNEWLQRAVAQVTGDDLRTVADNIEQIPEFQEAAEFLREFGLPVDCVITTVRDFFGWPSDPCDCYVPSSSEEMSICV